MNIGSFKIYFLNLSPTLGIKELLSSRLNQCMDLLPVGSRVQVLIKRAQEGIAYQAHFFFSSLWGPIKVTSFDMSLETLLEKIEGKLKSQVRIQRKEGGWEGNASPSVYERDANTEAADAIMEHEIELSPGG